MLAEGIDLLTIQNDEIIKFSQFYGFISSIDYQLKTIQAVIDKRKGDDDDDDSDENGRDNKSNRKEDEDEEEEEDDVNHDLSDEEILVLVSLLFIYFNTEFTSISIFIV